MHSLSVVHVDAQTVPLHCVYAHGACATCVQPPPPLQVPTGVTTAPPAPGAQVCMPHIVAPPGYWQATCVPSQVPMQLPLPLQVRPPTGGPVTGVHVPTLPATLHAWQAVPAVLPQMVEQQTP